jgi:hypothetical protein
MHTINVRKPNGRYRVVCGIQVVVEEPLSPAQKSALAASQARSAITRPAVPAHRIDATAGGRFQGWRCP